MKKKAQAKRVIISSKNQNKYNIHKMQKMIIALEAARAISNDIIFVSSL